MSSPSPLIKAILRTLAYSDVFDYPLYLAELTTYLIGYRLTANDQLREKVNNIPGIESQADLYFLQGRNVVCQRRQEKEKVSQNKLELAWQKTQILKMIPWIRLVGVTGRVAAGNTEPADDIDLLIITAPRRMWLSRLLEFVLLTLTGRRRQPGQIKGLKDKLCPNMYLSEEKLALLHQDLFSANELARMKVVWERGDTYREFIRANGWMREYLPNWTAPSGEARSTKSEVTNKHAARSPKLQTGRFRILDFEFIIYLGLRISNLLFCSLDALARFIQLKYMQGKRTTETVDNGLLMFHPQDARRWVIKTYQRRLRKLGLLP